ncbi:MAG TPA: 50S ribosomal protein L22 [Candidatus Saccharimonadales bacterium]|nr:50S ribosomal protein L22 [Candidatus Saccharimonadales bacterium]
MQVRAIAKSVRMSPRKVRLVADAIRQLSIEEAFMVLEATQNRAAAPLSKTLQSAVANAIVNNNIDRDDLVIESITVNEGQALKRFHPSSRGRVHPYKKKSSHISIVLKEKAVKKTAVAKVEKETGEETKFVKTKSSTKVDKGGKK